MTHPDDGSDDDPQPDADRDPDDLRHGRGVTRSWGPTSLVVVSGLASSTLLTLVLAPTLYSLLDDLAQWQKQVLRATHLHRA